MYYSQVEMRTRRRAVEGFNRLHRTWQFQNFWMPMVGRKPAELQPLSQIEETHRVLLRKPAGVQTIPLERICGSLGRVKDFDAQFRPRTAYTAERWIGIAMANEQGREMPAVQLVQVEESYFVVDGHHRISVALHTGRLEIDADVEMWNVEPKNEATTPCLCAESRSSSQAIAERWESWRHTVAAGMRSLTPGSAWRTATGTR